MRVAVTDLCVQLGGRDVLRGVSLPVEDGEFLGLLGPNGSGKTTLLRTLFGAVTPVSGRVTIGEDDVANLGRRELAQLVAVMLQESSTEFDLTVEEVVTLGRLPHLGMFAGPSRHDREVVAEALCSVAVDDLAPRLLRTLSGGQRQRTMLARALAQEGRVLVLDEPTNHLDIAHQLDLMHRARQARRTTLAALHDLNLAARHCDRIAVLRDGRLVAHGRPHTVLTADLLRDVFGVRGRVLDDPVSGAPVIVTERLTSTDPSTATDHCTKERRQT